jgi:hypothetical protein
VYTVVMLCLTWHPREKKKNIYDSLFDHHQGDTSKIISHELLEHLRKLNSGD